MSEWRRWTNKEDEYLKYHWTMPDEDIGRILGRTAKAVCWRRSILNVPHCVWEVTKAPEQISQTEKEARILKLAKEMKVRLLG